MTKQVSNPLNESVSAFIDGETNELDTQRLLRAADQEGEVLAASLKRYQLVGSAMRDEMSSFSQMDISSAVSEAISEEPEHKQNVVRGAFDWWKGAAGRTAVAASVAFAIVIGVQQYNGTDTINPGEAVASNVPEGFEAPTLNARTVGATAGSEADSSLFINNELMRRNVEQMLYIDDKYGVLSQEERRVAEQFLNSKP